MRDDSDETRAAGALRSRGGWLLWAAVLVVLVHTATLWGTGPVDDDYIVYRYARNWLAGDGVVFNVGGPQVEGATSPLWFLVCALGVRLGVAPEVWSPAIGIVAAAILTLSVGRAASRVVRGPLEWLPAWLVALSPAVAWHANAGLGTLPMAAAIAVGIDRWSAWKECGSRRELAAGALAFAVACALRPEAVIVWVLWLAVARPTGALRPIEWLWALAPLLALVAITGVRWAVFGTLLPHAFHLKSLPLTAELEYGARYLVRSASEGGIALLLLLGAAVPSGNRCARVVGVAAVVVLVQVLVVGGDWMVFGRFLVPFVALAALAGAAAVGRVRAGIARGAGVVALLAVTLLGWTARPQAVFESRFFEAWWCEVGDRFEEKAPAGSTVALSPIGAFGWRSELPIVDVLGLTHDAFTDLEPDLEGVGVKGHHRHDGSWVLDQRPDYLLLGNAVVQPDSRSLDVNPWEADIVRDPRFAREYEPFDFELRRADGSMQTLPYFVRKGAQPLR